MKEKRRNLKGLAAVLLSLLLLSGCGSIELPFGTTNVSTETGASAAEGEATETEESAAEGVSSAVSSESGTKTTETTVKQTEKVKSTEKTTKAENSSEETEGENSLEETEAEGSSRETNSTSSAASGQESKTSSSKESTAAASSKAAASDPATSSKATTAAAVTTTAAAHAHSWTSAVTQEPTCGTEGIRTYTCAGCGSTYTEKIPATGEHTYAYSYNGSRMHIQICSVCGYQSGAVACTPVVTTTDTGASSICSVCGGVIFSYNYSTLIQEEFDLTNQARIDAGLPALTYNSAPQYIANRRAREIVATFSHDAFDALPKNEIALIGTSTWGENIAYGYMSAASVHTAFMASAGHKENILWPNYTSITIGVYYDASTGYLYWDQIFGDK